MASAPPWTAFPELERHSIGWRMGGGEEAYNAFYRMFSRLSEIERAAYERENPPPAEWSDIYDLIRKSPWP